MEFPVIRVFHGEVQRSRHNLRVTYDPPIAVECPAAVQVTPTLFDQDGFPTRYRATVTPQP